MKEKDFCLSVALEQEIEKKFQEMEKEFLEWDRNSTIYIFSPEQVREMFFNVNKEFVRRLKEDCLCCGLKIIKGGSGNNKSQFCNSCYNNVTRRPTLFKERFFNKIDKLVGEKLTK